MIKYILMLMISFSAMADDIYEAELKGFLASANERTDKAIELYYEMDEIAKGLIKQNAKTKKRTMDYFDKIIRSCRAGDEVDIPSSDGAVYRIECEMVEVAQ